MGAGSGASTEGRRTPTARSEEERPHLDYTHEGVRLRTFLWQGAVFPMSKRKFKNTSTANLDPTTLANLKTLERQRKNANRALLKRRRQKSGQ